METYWLCDTCGGRINSPAEGIMEWYTFKDEEGVTRHINIRLVHVFSSSPLKNLTIKKKGCEFDLREVAPRVRPEGVIENLPMAEFLGADGLMRLLSFVAEGNFPTAEIVRMIKRLHVPGFEVARHFFGAASYEGIVREGTPDSYHDQQDINAVLQWLEARQG